MLIQKIARQVHSIRYPPAIGRPLQLSLNEDGVALAQPRLVTDGDVKGGRYVSGVVDIYVGTGPAH
jgi:hypothetical protein